MARPQGTETAEASVMTQGTDANSLLNPAPRERKRPLRTYGKRSAPVQEPEAPSPKRQRVASAKEEEAPRKESQPQLPKHPRTRPPPKRDSILSYFKRVPSSSSIPAVPSSDTVEPTLTPPPSSPIPSFTGREKRRLTTRLDIGGERSLRIKTNYGATKYEDREETDVPERQPDGGLDAGLSLGPNSRRQRKPMLETTSSKLNVLESVTMTTKNLPGGKKKTGKRRPKDMVQTTLNLSLKADSGFTICKECGVLYNPLNEKDRKEHKKQHAAYVRSKAKGKTSASP